VRQVIPLLKLQPEPSLLGPYRDHASAQIPMASRDTVVTTCAMPSLGGEPFDIADVLPFCVPLLPPAVPLPPADVPLVIPLAVLFAAFATASFHACSSVKSGSQCVPFGGSVAFLKYACVYAAAHFDGLANNP
jgi:hypothetical protein